MGSNCVPGFAGQRLREARTNAGLSRAQLACAIGRTKQSVALYERGLGAPPIRVCQFIAELLGVKLEDLLPETTDRQAS